MQLILCLLSYRSLHPFNWIIRTYLVTIQYVPKRRAVQYFLHRDHILYTLCFNALGNTIDEIAVEKAGIMKSGVDVLVGPGCPTDLMKVSYLMKSFYFTHYIDTIITLHIYPTLLDASNT